MNLSEVQAMLEQNRIDYDLVMVSDRMLFYRKQGFPAICNSEPFRMITIPNPNHSKEIHLIFDDASSEPEFQDLEFGEFGYELWQNDSDTLKDELLAEIKRIMAGNTYVIFATNAKTGKWYYDAAFSKSENPNEDDMDEFHKAVTRIRHPKKWWNKLIGRIDAYEIFNWQNYERIIKRPWFLGIKTTNANVFGGKMENIVFFNRTWNKIYGQCRNLQRVCRK